MESARAALSLARIAGSIGFAGLTLSVFSPLLAGFFLSLGRILRDDLEQGFHALLKVLLRLFPFVIFVFFWHKISPTMKALVFALLFLVPSGQAQDKPTRANNKACCKIYDAANELAITVFLAAHEDEGRTSDQEQHKPTKETRILGLSRDGFAQVLVSFILAIITAIYAFLTWRMLHKVGAQVEIMQKQVENAGEQLIAAQISNQVMFQQIGQMRIANEHTGRLIEQATVNADAARKSADALVDSERAWIGAEFVLAGEASQRYELHVTNYGRTPGKITNFKCGARCIIAWQEFEPFGEMVTFPDNNLLLIPNEPHTLADFVLTDYFAEEEWSEILLGIKQAIMYATVYYEDMTRRPHETSFCYMYRIPSKKMEEVRKHRKYS